MAIVFTVIVLANWLESSLLAPLPVSLKPDEAGRAESLNLDKAEPFQVSRVEQG